MKKFTRRFPSFYFRQVTMSVLLLIVPLFYAGAQSFAPTNVYNGWSTSTQAFATVPTAPGLTFSQIARGSGITSTSAPVSSGITSQGWAFETSEAAATAANKFFYFNITANSVTSFQVSSILFSLQRSGTGPTSFQIQASVNGGLFTSFGTPFTTSVNGTFVQLVTPSVTLSVPTAGNVVFRLVGWNSSNSAGTFRINNNTAINGTYSGVAPTLTTTGVTGAPFCVSSTSGAATTVSYSGTGTFTPGNIFTAQISDASGSFAAPVAIGTVSSTSLTGTINAIIPAGTAPGTSYRVRVVSSSPVVTGSDNGADLIVLQGIGFAHVTTNITCNGDANGSVVTTISDGVSPYTYAWSNSATTSSITNLTPGTYSLIITSANGCTGVISSAVITEPAVLAAGATATDISCNGATNGAATLSVSGGTTPYTYAWSNSATTQNLSNLSSGTYTVLITDNNGCTQTASATITEPALLNVTATGTNIQCNSAANGDVTLTVNGGTSPYTYAWSNSATAQNISNLTPGTYSVTVTDNNGCTQTASATLTEPSAISALAVPTQATCNGGSNGAISLSIGGGISPYTFLWSNNSTTPNLSNVVAGTYSVVITDNNGCTHTASAIITEPAAISASATPIDLICNGGANGQANLTVSGGTSPYMYAWSNSATTQNISNLAAGTYSVVITDNSGCTQTTSVTVAEPNAIVTTTIATDVLCNNGTNGDVNLSVNGGTSPYTYAWSNSATTQNISNLAAGTYSVVITDNSGCTQTTSVTVIQPNAIVATTTATDVLCNSGTNGDVNLSVNGGTAPYTYAWSNSATTQNISNLAAGTYSVIVTDDNGCTQTTTVTVGEPSSITSTLDSIDASCGTCSNGSADLTVNGGTSPYTYAWSNSSTSEDLVNVMPGTYTVVITDNNGCQHTDTITVNFSTNLQDANAATENISVYPNPSNGENIFIRLPEAQTSTEPVLLTVYDVTGNEVYTENLVAGNMVGLYRVNLSLADGVYTFSIVQDESVYAAQLIITR